jgi:type II secretory pathway component PulK
VIGTLTVCLVLITGAQVSLRSSATQLRIRRAQQSLRAACLLGLREGMQRLNEDTLTAFDDPREEWAQPLRFRSSDGVELHVQVTDAQSRFNLNHLSRPITPATVRTPEEMFADLLIQAGLEVDPGLVRPVANRLREDDITLHDPRQLITLQPELAEAVSVLDPVLSALPPPATGVLKVNLNTVDPAVLSAIVGPSLQGWVNQVMRIRETEPIPSVVAAARALPPLVQDLLRDAVDVRSTLFEISVVCQADGMERTLRAVVRRSAEDGVEVIRCQW